MGEYKRLALLFVVMIGIAVVMGATAIGVLYEAAVDRERARLVNIAQSQARLLEALLRRESSADGLRTGAVEEILEAHRRVREQVIGQTAELLLARREGASIVFLTPARGSQHPIDPIPFGGPAAEPMSAALAGQSGTMIGRDYAGRRVLAAFEPVQGLGLGLVAKIDMAEINGTYLQAGAIAGAASLAAVVAGALLFFRVGEPIVRCLRESEERYRSLVETQPDPICRFLPDTTLTFVNRAYAEFYGRAPEELLGRRWIDFAARGERPRFLDELTLFTPQRPERREESASTGADGTRRWHLCHLRAFFDTAGKVASFQSFATDITDRKRAEQRLSEQLSLLTAITDSAADAIFVSDGEERITFINLAAERIFGWSRQELLGRKLHDSLHNHHLDGHPYPASECPLSRVYKTGETVVGHEDVFFRKGGSPVEVACSNAPMRIEGRIVGAILVAHDITARKRTEAALRESEARYRAAGEAIRYGVWVCDASGGVTFVSQIFLDLIGKTLDEVQPRGWFDRLPPEDRKPAMDAWRACVAAGGDWTWEHHVKGADGIYRTILSLGRPVRDEGNRIVSWVGFNLDISARKEAEQALRESEGRLRRTVEDAPFPIMVHAEDGEVVHVSQAWLTLTGYRREEIGTIAGWTEHAYGERKAMARADIDRLYALDGALDEGEAVIRTADGRTRVWTFSSAPIGRDERGRRLVVSMAADVTERKTAERALRESDARMRALLDASQDEILLLSTCGEILAINKAAERRLEKRTGGADPLGADLSRLLPQDQAEQRLAIVQQVAETAILAHCDVPIRSRWFEFWYYPVLTSDKPVSEVAVYAREITQQKKSQADLSKLFQAIQQSPTSVVITDHNGNIEYVNPKFTEVTGYTLDEAIGKNPRILKSGHTPAEQYVDLWKTITSGRVWRGEVLNKKKSGELFWELASIAPVKEGERVTNFVAVKEDITERREMEEQLRQSQKMQAVGQLTGGIAHDFNNLLAIVIGNLQLLQERTIGDAKSREYVSDALWSAKRGGELTHRLLAFARKQPLKPAVIDLNTVVRGMTELLRRTLGMSIQIEESLAPDLWKAVADRGELERALVNLAVNSRDAMRGDGTLSLETHNAFLDVDYADQYEEVTPGEYVLLAVTDTGSGMTSETVQRVFEPFFTTKEVGQGSGLGLSMVYGFVKQSGGHISIYSRVDQGTSVKVYLPRAPLPGKQPEDAAAEVMPEALGEKVVLVVEDEAKLRKVAVKMLERLGLRSMQAETAKDALELLADAHVDVLFTDIELPGGMNGTQLADVAHGLYPELKVLFTTGYARETTLHEHGLHECAPWLLKPYSHQDLGRELKALLAPTLH